MRSFRHWTPQYIYDRAFDIWYQKRHPNHPWLTPQAIAIMQCWLKSTDKGIEWGTGRSTVWFAERIEQIVSIEHDPVWYEKTALQLKKKGIANKVDYRLLPVMDGSPPPPIHPHEDYIAIPKNYPYSDVVNVYPDEFFDFALVDGKIRHVCMDRVLPKLRPGGMLILDNSERYVPHDSPGTYYAKVKREAVAHEEWKGLLARVKHWRTIVTTNGVSCTRIWIKPC